MDRSVLFLGGKGGVGKTTMASAFALRSARAGRRTLLVSTDPAHSTGDMLGVALGPDPHPVLPHLDAIEIDPVHEADRYIGEVKARLADTTPPRLLDEVERQIDIARVTPGAEEAAVFERFTRLLDELGRRYDRLVFDTAPLGHTLRLLALPEQMTVWVSGLVGRRRRVAALSRMWRTVAGAAAGDAATSRDAVLDLLEARIARFRRARALVTDADRAAFVFVAHAERLAVLETERAVQVLRRHRIPVGGVIVNRVHLDGPKATQESQHMARLREIFAGRPTYAVPELSTEVHGLRALEGIVAELTRQEGSQLAMPPVGGLH